MGESRGYPCVLSESRSVSRGLLRAPTPTGASSPGASPVFLDIAGYNGYGMTMRTIRRKWLRRIVLASGVLVLVLLATGWLMFQHIPSWYQPRPSPANDQRVKNDWLGATDRLQEALLQEKAALRVRLHPGPDSMPGWRSGRPSHPCGHSPAIGCLRPFRTPLCYIEPGRPAAGGHLPQRRRPNGPVSPAGG